MRKGNERGISYRQLNDRFSVSFSVVFNLLKRKYEHITDDKTNRSKKLKRKCKNNLNQEINERKSDLTMNEIKNKEIEAREERKN